MSSHEIIDSALTKEEALRQNPHLLCPLEILNRQVLLDVLYFSFDGKLHKGQIVIDENLATDVLDGFTLIKKMKFPIASVIPIADSHFHWDDQISVKANNSSGFNYRNILKTTKLSSHSYGRAIDINPKLNPYVRSDLVSPKGAVYDPSQSGTIVSGDRIVTFFKERDWEWGGDWDDRKDYQHFQKLV